MTTAAFTGRPQRVRTVPSDRGYLFWRGVRWGAKNRSQAISINLSRLKTPAEIPARAAVYGACRQLRASPVRAHLRDSLAALGTLLSGKIVNGPEPATSGRIPASSEDFTMRALALGTLALLSLAMPASTANDGRPDLPKLNAGACCAGRVKFPVIVPRDRPAGGK